MDRKGIGEPLTDAQAAKALEISTATAENDWVDAILAEIGNGRRLAYYLNQYFWRKLLGLRAFEIA